MKAEHLRIGNLVYRENSKLINQKNEVYKIENVNLQSAQKYEPIPLTEEWLLKMGFEKDGKYYSKGSFHYHEFGHIFIGNDHVSSGHVDALIKYIHELQNLYYALKKKELTIK